MSEIFNPFALSPNFEDEDFGLEELEVAQRKAFQSHAVFAALKTGERIFTNPAASGYGARGEGPKPVPTKPAPPPSAPRTTSKGGGGGSAKAGQPRGTNAVAVSSPSANAMQAVTNNTSRSIATTMVVDVGFQNEKEWEDPLKVKKAGGGKAKSFDRRKRKARRGDFHKVQRPQDFNEIIKKAVGETPRSLGPVMTPEKRMTALASGAQAAVVKILSTGGGRASVSNMIDYNSREAAMPLERENGELVTTREQHKAMLDEWEAFFDKREPSKDVVTLTVTIDDPASDLTGVKEAIAEVYKDQRLVMGEATDDDGRRQIVVVMSIASEKKGRIKTTDHAREKVHDQLKERLGANGPYLALEYGEVGHGAFALEKQLTAAVARSERLSGPKDALVSEENVTKIAKSKSWARSLRSYGNRDVMHIAVSSKAGTDEKAFIEAVRDFLGHEFAGHKYAFALHGPHDTAVDVDGC